MPQLNQPAPDFTLQSHTREETTLSGLKGKNVILAFYPAAFTGVCENQVCSFRNSLSELNDANATVFGVSVDSPFSNGAFASKNELNFDLLCDAGKATIAAYDIEFPNFAGIPGYTVAKRSVFVIDAEGILRYQWVAPNPGVEPNYDEVKAFVKSL